MHLLLVLLLVGGFAEFALAGTATFSYGGTPVVRTTTAAQDKKIVRLKEKENQERAAAIPPIAPLTTEEYVDTVYVNTLMGLSGTSDKTEYQDFCTVFVTLSLAQKNQIIAAGGDNNPCP